MVFKNFKDFEEMVLQENWQQQRASLAIQENGSYQNQYYLWR